MIKRMIVKNFKSLRRIDITLGPLNLFIGANASGKANLLEVLRVVEGVGNGLTIDQVLNGRPRTATCTEWEGIRGGNQLAYPIGPGRNRDDNRVARQLSGDRNGPRPREERAG